MLKRFLALGLCLALVLGPAGQCFAAGAETSQPAHLQEEQTGVQCVADIRDILSGIKATYIPDITFFVSRSDQRWVGYDDMNGDLTKPCSDKEAGNSHGRFGGVWQSHGFARFVFFSCFGKVPEYDYHCNPSSLNDAAYVVGRYASSCQDIRGDADGPVSEANLKALFAKAKIGDLIVLAPPKTCFLKGTSMVFLGTTAAGVLVYQADYTGACVVTENTIPYSTIASYHCVTLLRSTSYPAAEYLPPLPVAQLSSPAKDIALNDSMTISWLPGKYATSYKVRLLKDGAQAAAYETEETLFSTNFTAAGAYQLEVVSVNDLGESSPVLSDSFTVHAPSAVEFRDYNGTLLTSQQVVYGGDATAPAVPARKGYLFAGWDSALTDIRKDTVITANYEIEQYTLNYYSVGKLSKIYTQRVAYGSAATPPEDVNNLYGIDEDCTFAGWHIEYGSEGTSLDSVDGDMTLIASQTWKLFEVPIVITLNQAVLQGDGKTYHVSGSATNSGDASFSFKLIPSVRTSGGKMVKCVIGDEHTLAPGETVEINDDIIYQEKASTIEYIAVGIKDNDKTGGTLSECVSVNVTAMTAWTDWSEWTTTCPANAAGRQIESKVQYRARDKVFADSSTQTWTAPWVYLNSTYVWSSYGSYGPWQASAIASSDFVYVQTRTAYEWFYYACPYCGNHSYYNSDATWAGGCGNWINDKYYRTTWGPSYSTGTDWHGTARWVSHSTDAGTAFCWRNGADGRSQKQYRCKTRSQIFTYHYWKWGDWTAWSDSAVSGLETDTRTLYRYRDAVSVSDPNAGTEDTSGKTYYLHGIVPGADNVDLESTAASVLVYKKTNTDPTEAQLEYVGYTTIGSGNSYSVAITPKETPSEVTGDFIVSLGFAGSDKLVNVDVIPAENITYNVKFIVDGEVINGPADPESGRHMGEAVAKGYAATLPAVPEKEGYTFVKWSESTSEINSDLEINALFKPNTYSVTFIDWEAGTVTACSGLYGDTIDYPALDDREGVSARQWKNADTVTTITGNLIFETEAVKQQYTVTFVDGETVVSTQKVFYGEAAQLPAAKPLREGMKFSSWTGDCDYTYITRDVEFSPVFVYEDTVSAPTAETADAGNGIKAVTLNCADQNAAIYYIVEDGAREALQQMESEEIIEMAQRLDLLYAQSHLNLCDCCNDSDIVHDGGNTGIILPIDGPGIIPVSEDAAAIEYNFFDHATEYTGEPVILQENQSIVFMAAAAGKNDSIPVFEYGEDVFASWDARVTENTLRQYRSSVEGEIALTVSNMSPSYKECLLTLCLYNEKGVLNYMHSVTAELIPGVNEIVFCDVNAPASAGSVRGKLIVWDSNMDAVPVLDVFTFDID